MSIIRWGFKKDTGVTITSFTLTKSVDKALTFSALTVITFDVNNSAVFDRATDSFFYDDVAANPGDIYKIVATGSNGTSIPVFAIVPLPTPAACTIIGYVLDGFGESDKHLNVVIETAGGPQSEIWMANPDGLVAQSNEALGITRADTVVQVNQGMWQASLLQGSYARITIPALRFDWSFRVPKEEGPINIRDIPQLRGSSFDGLYPGTAGTRERITTG